MHQKWRRGRDSNPRGDLRPPIDLANRPLQPLGYLSATEENYNILCANEESAYLKSFWVATNRCRIVLMQPGQTITPGGTQETPNWQFNPNSTLHQIPSHQLIICLNLNLLNSLNQVSPKPVSNEGEVKWTASEFIAHDKTSGWYVILAVAAVATSQRRFHALLKIKSRL